MKIRTHRDYLKAIGRKPVRPDQLRTARRPGDIEIVWCPRTRDWVKHVHEGIMAE